MRAAGLSFPPRLRAEPGLSPLPWLSPVCTRVFPDTLYQQRRSLWLMLEVVGERQPPVPYRAGRCPRRCSALGSTRGD